PTLPMAENVVRFHLWSPMRPAAPSLRITVGDHLRTVCARPRPRQLVRRKAPSPTDVRGLSVQWHMGQLPLQDHAPTRTRGKGEVLARQFHCAAEFRQKSGSSATSTSSERLGRAFEHVANLTTAVRPTNGRRANCVVLACRPARELPRSPFGSGTVN